MSSLTLPAPLRAIFVDLDGVLADFHRRLAELYGLDPDNLSEAQWAELGEWGLGIEKPGFWERIRSEGTDWWAQLPPLPWTDRLWAACQAACDRVIVLTTPGPFPESAAGKYRWVSERLNTHLMLIGSPKDVCSKPGHILIDDRSAYGPRWEAEGGTLVSLRRPWNADGRAPSDIIAALDRIARSGGGMPSPTQT